MAGGAHLAQHLEGAFVHTGSRHTDVDQAANRRFAPAALGEAGLEFGDALLNEGDLFRFQTRTPARRFVRGPQPDQCLQQRRAVDRQENLFHAAIPQIAIAVQGGDDPIRDHGLHLEQGIVGRSGPALPAHLLGQLRDLPHQRVAVRKEFKGQFGRIELVQPFGGLRAGERLDEGLEQGAIQAKVDLRHPSRGGETALVLGIGLDDGPQVVEGAWFETHDPVAAHQIRVGGLRRLGGHDGFVQAGRQYINQINVGRELLMLLLGHPTRDEDAEMADAFMDGVDDGLGAGADVVVLLVQIDDPAQRLLRRGDVVALGAEAEDRRADVAQVNAYPVAGDDFGGGQPVADEQLIHDPLHFLGVEIDVAAPPFLEFQEARSLGIHFRPEIVILGPEGIGGIEILEVFDQMGAVELAGAEVAGERSQPTAAVQAAGVAHRVLPLDPGPVGQRRAGDDERAEQFGPGRGHHQHRPAGLAVADHAGLTFSLGMQFDDLFQEPGLGAHDVFDGLARHRVRAEADEVTGMAGAHRHAQFAVGLEAADARSVASARVHHHERAFFRVDYDAFRRLDPNQPVIDRTLQGPAVQHQLVFETEHVRHRLGFLCVVLVTALAQHVPEQDGALPAVNPVIHGLLGDGGQGLLRGEGSEELGWVGHGSYSSEILVWPFPAGAAAAIAAVKTGVWLNAGELRLRDHNRQRYRHHGHSPAMGSCWKSMVNR